MGKMRAEGTAPEGPAAQDSAEETATGLRGMGLTGEALRSAAEAAKGAADVAAGAAQAAKGLVIDKMILGSIDKLKGGGLAAAQGVASAVRLGSGRIDTQDNMWVTEDEVKLIDDYADSKAWGVDVAEWRMWEAYVVGKDIGRKGKTYGPTGESWETGRESSPELMALNLQATRSASDLGASDPPPVVWQYDVEDPMNPVSLVLAYQEARVRPVVSDFDCLLCGTRGINYLRPADNQTEVLQWLVDQLRRVLGDPRRGGWMQRWFSVLSETQFHPVWPPHGFGDPTSYQHFKHTITQMRGTCGGVRHGPESFNYYFPQDIVSDGTFLVMWEGWLKTIDPDNRPQCYKAPFRHLSEPELRAFLLERVGRGFIFPLNPKWVVCDEGWYEIYKALVERGGMKINTAGGETDPEAVQRAIQKEKELRKTGESSKRRASMAKGSAKVSLDNWLPASVRKEIEAIHRKHPNGFTQTPTRAGQVVQTLSSDVAMAKLQKQNSRRGGRKSSLSQALAGAGAWLARHSPCSSAMESRADRWSAARQPTSEAARRTAVQKADEAMTNAAAHQVFEALEAEEESVARQQAWHGLLHLLPLPANLAKAFAPPVPAPKIVTTDGSLTNEGRDALSKCSLKGWGRLRVISRRRPHTVAADTSHLTLPPTLRGGQSSDVVDAANLTPRSTLPPPSPPPSAADGASADTPLQPTLQPTLETGADATADTGAGAGVGAGPVAGGAPLSPRRPPSGAGSIRLSPLACRPTRPAVVG